MTDEEKRPEEESVDSGEAAESSEAEASSEAAESSEAEKPSESAESSEAEKPSEAAESSEDSGQDTTSAEEPSAGDVAAAASHDSGHSDEHFAHPLPMPLLGGVLFALILLTVLTVGVTAIDLGSQGNFIVAMIIATVKAGLVMAYFMHMVWDSKFNVVAFTSSFLFVLLFLAMSTLDRGEYRDKIDTYEADQKAQAQN